MATDQPDNLPRAEDLPRDQEPQVSTNDYSGDDEMAAPRDGSEPAADGSKEVPGMPYPARLVVVLLAVALTLGFVVIFFLN